MALSFANCSSRTAYTMVAAEAFSPPKIVLLLASPASTQLLKCGAGGAAPEGDANLRGGDQTLNRIREVIWYVLGAVCELRP